MPTISTAQWKSEQREILRAAFAPAFVKYTELVNKVHDPDDWRKYLLFIAQQTGLEEPVFKANAHDGLTMVNISIGAFHANAAPLSAVPPRPVGLAREPMELVDDVLPKMQAAPQSDLMDARTLAADVVEEEVPAADYDSILDDLMAR